VCGRPVHGVRCVFVLYIYSLLSCVHSAVLAVQRAARAPRSGTVGKQKRKAITVGKQKNTAV
jgi:hypothetical protein